MMHSSTSVHGHKNRPAHVGMAPPEMVAMAPVTYREKDLPNEIGGQKFSGNHHRSLDYIQGIETILPKLLLLPYANGAASVIVLGNVPVRYADVFVTASQPSDAPSTTATGSGSTTDATSHSSTATSSGPMSMGQFMPDFAQSPPVPFGDDPFSFSGEEKDSSPFD